MYAFCDPRFPVRAALLMRFQRRTIHARTRKALKRKQLYKSLARSLDLTLDLLITLASRSLPCASYHAHA